MVLFFVLLLIFIEIFFVFADLSGDIILKGTVGGELGLTGCILGLF